MEMSYTTLWLYFDLIAAAASAAGGVKSCENYPTHMYPGKKFRFQKILFDLTLYVVCVWISREKDGDWASVNRITYVFANTIDPEATHILLVGPPGIGKTRFLVFLSIADISIYN